jgi:lipid-A-disaccharide synthase
MNVPTILLSAGEASSDMYAARLARDLQEQTGARLFGMGGPRMAEAGVELIADYHEVAVVGIAEVLGKIPSVVRVQNRLAREAVDRKADLAILVDSPGTHLGVARRLKPKKIPVGYFIGPQIWAWRAGRVRIVRRRVKKMVVIFPFEEPIYQNAGVPVEFVGHPLVDVVKATKPRDLFAAEHSLDPEKPIVVLLPGSRKNEIARNYPIIAEACAAIAAAGGRASQTQFVLVAAPGLGPELFAAHEQDGLRIHRVQGSAYNVLAAADCAIVASGTATIEAALLKTPMVVVYRVSPLSAWLARPLIHTKFFAMPNLIAGGPVVPELIQDAFTAPALEREARRLIESSEARAQARLALQEVSRKLGPGGAIERAAAVFAALLNERSIDKH